MLIDFDDETEINPFQMQPEAPAKIEYESLFTIIFEPLEIKTILFFLMTNQSRSNIFDFFGQLYENLYLYKNNRRFDIMYFLLPNLDFFIRNESYAVYIVNQPNAFDESLDMLSDYTVSYVNEYTDAVFLSLYFKELLKVQYNPENDGIYYIDKFIPNLIPNPQFMKALMKFDMSTSDVNNFISRYEREFKICELLTNNCNMNMIIILVEKGKNPANFQLVIQKMINLLDKTNFKKSSLVLRFIEVIKKKAYEDKENFDLCQKCNEVAQVLLNDSFIYGNRERMRKIIVEYYCSYQCEEGEDLLNTSNENINVKTKTPMRYHKWKVYYSWFLTEKNIKKMKDKIFTLFESSEKYEKFDKKNYKRIFDFVFDKKYFLHRTTFSSGRVSYFDMEKMFYL